MAGYNGNDQGSPGDYFAQWQAAWIQAVGRAWSDENFRQALLEDPRAAIKAYMHIDLPGGFPVQVVESDDGRLLREMILTIPVKPEKDRDEASALAKYARSILTDTAFLCMC